MINEKTKSVDEKIVILQKQLCAIRRNIFIYGDSRLNIEKLEHDINACSDRMWNYVDEDEMADRRPL